MVLGLTTTFLNRDDSAEQLIQPPARMRLLLDWQLMNGWLVLAGSPGYFSPNNKRKGACFIFLDSRGRRCSITWHSHYLRGYGTLRATPHGWEALP